jgi:uncharacterized protein
VNAQDRVRLSLIPVLAERHPTRHIGRTALMKYMYFLQTLRNVPLGYNFTIYSYGPFDSDVLADLSTAEALGAVRSTAVSFQGGYGYRIEATPTAERLKLRENSFLTQYDKDISWVIQEFGGLNSAELELASTIVYVDRELEETGNPEGKAGLIGLVNDIKSHFSRAQVERTFDLLQNKGLIVSI